jgi:hypothetical protein
MMRCATIFFAVLLSGCGGSQFTTTATASDGGGAGGGGLDGAPQDGAGLSWCASRPTPPTFCADFDETTDLASVVSAWTDGEAGNGTAAVLGDPAAPSLPNVLSATADGTVAFNKSGSLTLGESVTREEAIRSAHAETAIRLDQGKITGSLDSVTFLGLYLAGNTFFLALVKAGLVLGIQGPGDAGALNFTSVGGPLTPGQWAGSFALDVDLESGKVKVSHDALDVADTTVPLPPQPIQSVTMAIGVVTFGQTGVMGFSFDNVRMDVN